MHRIDTSTAQVDKFGAGKNGFTGGNPQTGELPTALDAEFFDSVQEEIAAVIEAAGLKLAKSNRAQLLAAMNSLVGSGRLLNVQVFTASGIYTPTPGTKSIIVEVQGAGGGGGGIGASSSANVAVGNGGGAGGYAKSRLTSGFTGGIQVNVGIGGPGGNLSPTVGSSGGLSSFGSTIVANGGDGGYAQPQTPPPYGVTGSLGGIATGGNLLNIRGGASAAGGVFSTGNVAPGNGGSSQLGSATLSPSNNAVLPYAAYGYGSGGGGSYTNNKANGFAGGAGANGVVIIWEYA
ncbi:carbohydrate kinase [Pantoea agglomerans]|uniref:glycine-rich domain-containing protein n=1 Tax=Enterobacter agglomerans TaxID=549 RepID=UPI003207B20E